MKKSVILVLVGFFVILFALLVWVLIINNPASPDSKTAPTSDSNTIKYIGLSNLVDAGVEIERVRSVKAFLDQYMALNNINTVKVERDGIVCLPETREACVFIVTIGLDKLTASLNYSSSGYDSMILKNTDGVVVYDSETAPETHD